MSDNKIVERLTQYQKLTDDVRKLEGAIDKIKKMKSDLAKSLLDENGKEHMYPMGSEGAQYFISASKAG